LPLSTPAYLASFILLPVTSLCTKRTALACLFLGMSGHRAFDFRTQLQHVRCAFSGRIVHSKMPLDPTLARLKLLHACDQCHSFWESTAYRCHHKLCPNTAGPPKGITLEVDFVAPSSALAAHQHIVVTVVYAMYDNLPVYGISCLGPGFCQYGISCLDPGF
jgi:hypothetical protein